MPIVKFLVSSLPLEKIISESDDIPFAIDYACGVGHFLTEYAEEIKKLSKKISAINPKEYNARTVGIEKEYRLSKVAKVSAFMYGHNEIKIIYGDALTPHENLKDDNFSVLVANPPYSVKGFLDTLTEDERNNFTLSKFVSDTSKNNSIETFFVERAKQLLKSGGVAAIILPVSILTNENIYEPCREIILKYFKIVAIVQLGSGTFGKTGTNTVTLFLQRRNTVPDDAEHYKNRVDAWFKSDDTKNKIFCDNEIIKNYCNFCKINFDEYKNWLTGDCLPTAEIFHAYVENFKNDSEYKKIARKNIPEDVRTAELEKFINNKIKSAEKKKLFYFWLASDENSDSVVIVKAPDSKDEIKKFLGYEWSNSKGSEGIKYIGATQNIISEISTPLFNPNDFDDVEKINLIIRKNFIGENISVPDSLADFVSIHRLRDLINFTNVDFNKAIKLTPTRNIVADEGKTIYKLNSRDFEISIGKRVLSTEIVENGKYPVFSANVFKEFGRIDKLNIDDFSLPSVIWGIDGDWMVNVIPANIKFYPTDHCGVLRVRTDKILTEYLAFVLRVEGEFEKFSRSNRASIERIKSLSVQIPPLDVQQKIISQFNAIDSAIKQREQNILKLDENIKNKFAEMFGSVKEKIKIGDCCEIEKGTNLTREQAIEGNIPVVAGGILPSCYHNKANRPKDIITISASGKNAGYVNLWRVPIFATDCNTLQTKNKFSVVYVYYALKNIQDEIFGLQKGSAQPHVYGDDISNLKIPVPPVELQKKFSEYVEVCEVEKEKSRGQKNELLAEREKLVEKYFK